ncbi:MAG: hypothetical protein IJR14_03295 [Synergistaceae bacterium]|nr:hypothetical protein [Synergistaceae bacterium]
MPDEVRAKAVEAGKLMIDLDDVLSRATLDRAKAVEIHGKIADLRREIDAWRFARKLDLIAKARAEREAAPKAGATEEE